MVQYRNKFEERIGALLGKKALYESCKVPYVVHRHYIPDFTLSLKTGVVHFECKGYFRVGDIHKYKSIRDSLETTEELVFVLYDPNKKVRKGGKMTMSEWCDKEGFSWYTEETIKNAFIK